MASLIENLITELNEEYAVYEALLSVSMEKTSAIVANDLDRLRSVTDKEQAFVDTLTGMDNTRRQTMANIASVLNRKTDLKVSEIVEFLEGQPEFHDALAEINEKLAKIGRRLKEVNAHNQNLIEESLSMITYNINLLQNLNRAPETAEYTRDMFRGAGRYQGSETIPATGSFDTKN
ncbi:MAG: flagellar protein FlgN [Lachnospiraceae bacterium]|nr:flagellar protein FlgN [Lachnospiraceae bacterium]